MDLVSALFLLIPSGYIFLYIYAFITYIFPWLNQALVEILNMTLWQLVSIFLFFIPGLGVFILCIAFVGALILD